MYDTHTHTHTENKEEVIKHHRTRFIIYLVLWLCSTPLVAFSTFLGGLIGASFGTVEAVLWTAFVFFWLGIILVVIFLILWVYHLVKWLNA